MEGRFREWLAGLGRRELLTMVVATVALAGGAGLWYLRSLPKPVRAIQAPASGPVAGPTASPTPASLFVHVGGHVRQPGVYEMRAGDRVIDAIERAGGARDGAELDQLNLAALLVDAQQILVPAKGKPLPAPAAGAGTGAQAESDVVNLNTATQEQLETLPGIGEVLAQRILDYRESNGPFRSVDDLTEVSGIGERRLEDLRPHVTV
ncbi:MAG TPA: ComEA family DNA-binding protein [Actinomycetota bacterium]|nr:ComEA family DNA-binding protein [Actinomycetota bacterium]